NGWMAPAFAAVVWGNWVVLDRVAAAPGSGSVAASIILTHLAAGGVLVFAGSGKFMEIDILLASAYAGIALVVYLRHMEFRGAIPASAVVLPGLLLMGHETQSEPTIHWTTLVLPAVAPLLLAIPMPLTGWPMPRIHALRIALVSTPLIAALIMARWQAG